MLLNDKQITDLCIEKGMITPFVGQKTVITLADGTKLPSYGLSSAGYDIRIAHVDFQILDSMEDRHYPATLFNNYFVLPPKSVALGVSVEFFNIPDDVMVVALMKSTYARQHVIHHITPLEPGWRGHLTFEIANLTHHQRKVYADAGIAQLIFHKLESPCQMNYAASGGKYQDQPMKVIHAR